MKGIHISIEQLSQVVLEKEIVILRNNEGVPLAALVPIEDLRYLKE